MIDYFEVNKTEKATCQRCRQFITDKMRGVSETIAFGHKNYHYFCIKCSGEEIKKMKRELFNLEATIRSKAKRLKTNTI